MYCCPVVAESHFSFGSLDTGNFDVFQCFKEASFTIILYFCPKDEKIISKNLIKMNHECHKKILKHKKVNFRVFLPVFIANFNI